MPYLPTPQAYLEQSALLLQAYPDAVRHDTQIPPLSIFPRSSPSSSLPQSYPLPFPPRLNPKPLINPNN
ncbi:uncharacterized protein BO72DRAFT_447454 [Aspergillus fijiensis CBS 313.89]|uniref:Uncharacterized protein n=1 Tax=Aspergillus fijiensis CBS 313.89 TaxID=1448319 RepID=A0A8G1RR85_9EURO|nr:uncharacterized protein BO72DRAFT_447454 [Aspergillus fijiensis CBS 313.89]RAK78005.1 hypothetical protein BO72DRAFT_447454 [Aspergillus fijiensis CBS 313.89]